MHKRIPAFIAAIPILLSALSFTAQGQSHRQGRLADSKNVLTFNAGVGAAGFPAASLALQYERFLTSDSRLSADLSLVRYYGGSIYFGSEFGPGDPPRSKACGWYAAPGIRYHPLGNTHRVDLGLGGAVAIGAAHRRDTSHPYGSFGFVNTTDDHLFAALLAQMNANFQASNGFVFGLFLNGGYILADAAATAPKADEATPLYLQFGIKMGGRW